MTESHQEQLSPAAFENVLRALAQAVSMVSIAFEETFGEGIGAVDTPLPECEMIAAIYRQKPLKDERRDGS